MVARAFPRVALQDVMQLEPNSNCRSYARTRTSTRTSTTEAWYRCGCRLHEAVFGFTDSDGLEKEHDKAAVMLFIICHDRNITQSVVEH